MLYHTGDSRLTQNIQINKVIGENNLKKCVFFFMKKKYRFFGQSCRIKVISRRVMSVTKIQEGLEKWVNLMVKSQSALYLIYQ